MLREVTRAVRRRPGSVNPTPHDSLVRAIFGQPQHAAAELGVILPAAVAASLDLGSLVPVAATFIDESLRASAADLVFAARFRDGSTAVFRGACSPTRHD